MGWVVGMLVIAVAGLSWRMVVLERRVEQLKFRRRVGGRY